MRPAVDAIQEGKWQLENEGYPDVLFCGGLNVKAFLDNCRVIENAHLPIRFHIELRTANGKSS